MRGWLGRVRAAARSRFWFDWPRESVIQLVVWVLAVVACLAIATWRSGSDGIVGVARGRIAQLSVPWSARVTAINVEPFQPVRRGEVLALLDDSLLRAQITTVRAEIERLRAEHVQDEGLLDADVRSRAADWAADDRAFEADAARLAVEQREVQVELDYDRALLVGLQANVARLDDLLARGHAAPSELELVRAEADATARKIAQNERLLADLERRHREAQGRSESFAARAPLRPSRSTAARHVAEAIAVQEGLLRELEAQREQCILRAPFDGRVVEIQGRAGEMAMRRAGEGTIRRPGEVVGPGEPVVVVAAERPTEVVAYAPDGRGAEVRPGIEVIVMATGSLRQRGSARIAAVSPTIERLPERLWPSPLFPQWGRPFVVPLPEGFLATAGDRVRVHIVESAGPLAAPG